MSTKTAGELLRLAREREEREMSSSSRFERTESKNRKIEQKDNTSNQKSQVSVSIAQSDPVKAAAQDKSGFIAVPAPSEDKASIPKRPRKRASSSSEGQEESDTDSDHQNKADKKAPKKKDGKSKRDLPYDPTPSSSGRSSPTNSSPQINQHRNTDDSEDSAPEYAVSKSYPEMSSNSYSDRSDGLALPQTMMQGSIQDNAELTESLSEYPNMKSLEVAYVVLSSSGLYVSQIEKPPLQAPSGSVPFISIEPTRFPGRPQFVFTSSDIVATTIDSKSASKISHVTIDYLIYLLATQTAQDKTFQDTIVLTHEYYMSSSVFLSVLIAMFFNPCFDPALAPSSSKKPDQPISPPMTPSLPESARTTSPTRSISRSVSQVDSILSPDVLKTQYQLRIINIIKKLIETRFFELKKSRSFTALLKKFILNLSISSDEAEARYGAVLRASAKVNVEHLREDIDSEPSAPAPVLAPVSSPSTKSKAKLFSTRKSFDDYNPIELARQMTLVDFELWMDIPLSELYHARFNSKDPNTCPRIAALTSRWNEVSQWVSSSIVLCSKKKARVPALSKFITLLDELRKLQNFHALMAVYSGLNQAAILRLRKTWKEIPSKTLTIWTGVCKFLDNAQDFKTYRDFLASATPPCIPYVGFLLGSLTYTEEFPDFIEEEVEAADEDIIQCPNVKIKSMKKRSSKDRALANPHGAPVLARRATYQVPLKSSLGEAKNNPSFQISLPKANPNQASTSTSAVSPSKKSGDRTPSQSESSVDTEPETEPSSSDRAKATDYEASIGSGFEAQSDNLTDLYLSDIVPVDPVDILTDFSGVSPRGQLGMHSTSEEDSITRSTSRQPIVAPTTKSPSLSHSTGTIQRMPSLKKQQHSPPSRKPRPAGQQYLNWRKMLMLGKSFGDILRFQRTKYDLVHVKEIAKYVTEMRQHTYFLDEEGLTNMSLQLEDDPSESLTVNVRDSVIKDTSNKEKDDHKSKKKDKKDKSKAKPVFADVHSDQILLSEYRKFLMGQYNHENLLFWEAVIKFKQTDLAQPPHKTQQSAQQIYDKFVSGNTDDSAFVIGFAYEIKDRIDKKMSEKDIDLTMFDEALGEVEVCVLQPSFSLFVQHVYKS